MNSPNTSSEVEKELETIIGSYKTFGLVDEDGNDTEIELKEIFEPDELVALLMPKINKALHQSEIKGRIEEVGYIPRVSYGIDIYVAERLSELNQMKGKDK